MWAGYRGMSASLNPAKGSGLEGCGQENPAVISHQCQHPGRLQLLQSHCRGTQQQASSEHPPHDHCRWLGGQGKEKSPL